MKKALFSHTVGERGFALFIAVLVASIVLSIGLSIINIAYKQLVFSNLGRESEIAFSAADAAMECALFNDYSTAGGKFNFGAVAASIPCFGSSITLTRQAPSGGAQTSRFETNWGNPAVCVRGEVTKYFSATQDVPIAGETPVCPKGTTCTRTTAKGYNITCAQLASPPARTVERALKASY